MNLMHQEQQEQTSDSIRDLALEAQQVQTEEQAHLVIKKFNKIYTRS